MTGSSAVTCHCFDLWLCIYWYNENYEFLSVYMMHYFGFLQTVTHVCKLNKFLFMNPVTNTLNNKNERQLLSHWMNLHNTKTLKTLRAANKSVYHSLNLFIPTSTLKKVSTKKALWFENRLKIWTVIKGWMHIII